MITIKRDQRGPDWSGPDWFNVGAPALVVCWRGNLIAHVWLWDCFRRVSESDHAWGVGLLHVKRRSLIYIGHDHVDLLWRCVWRRP